MVRILLIDDNETDRHLIKRELGQVFPELETPEIRDQAELDACLEDGAFDLAITDYQLQWTNGVLVLNALKTRYPTCPVIMFTGSGNEEIAATAMKAGLDDYVVKSPKHAIRLVTAVRAALETAEARRRATAAEREREDLL
ncbi:MAG TPA: response regulator, partial [Gemmataceae bacterium]|nr:response regulator [Gemmataceae bacterium]